MIRIVHTRACGTLVFGATRDDGPGTVIGSAPDRWRFSRAIGDEGAWYLANSRGHRVRHDAIDRLAAALRAAGHAVEVTITSSSHATAAIEADRAERAAGRAAFYTALANDRISSATVRLARSPGSAWTEVVPFCTDHAFEFQADIAAAEATDAATVEDLS
jgi:hypothetical protein